MTPLFGEFDCTLDAKGRFLVPAALLKQFPEGQRDAFVINHGLDKCLVLYPLQVWQAELAKIYSKNQYIEKNRAFARKFQSGAVPAEIDSSKRLLIPKRLMDHVGIDKEIVLIGWFDRVEIWSSAEYKRWQAEQGKDLARLSEEVMGNTDGKNGGDVS